MGHSSSKKKEAKFKNRLHDSRSVRSETISTIPTSISTAALSCIAGEFHQIHNQETLEAWRTKAIQTVDDLCSQKASYLRHEAHLNSLLGQLRALIHEEQPLYGSTFVFDEKIQDNGKIEL